MDHSEVSGALRRRLRHGWQANVHWRAVDGAMDNATVTLATLPQPFAVFEHPEVAEGRRMQIAALSVDRRRRSLRLDLTGRVSDIPAPQNHGGGTARPTDPPVLS